MDSPSDSMQDRGRSIGGSRTAPIQPQPLEALQGNAPPPFLTKTYDMVDDPATDSIISWSSTNNSFVVWNPPEFSRDLLPRYFKHSNYSSFVRQLNTYGFKKVDPDRWEFANEDFLRGHKSRLKGIHRRRNVHAAGTNSSPRSSPGTASALVAEQQPCVEIGQFGGIEGEVERLRRDRNMLMLELVRMRQQQMITHRGMQQLSQRLHVTEQRQQQMMSFLAKAMQNPTFLAQLLEQQELAEQLLPAQPADSLVSEKMSDKVVVKKRRTPRGPLVKYPNLLVSNGLSSGSSSSSSSGMSRYDMVTDLSPRVDCGNEEAVDDGNIVDGMIPGSALHSNWSSKRGGKKDEGGSGSSVTAPAPVGDDASSGLGDSGFDQLALEVDAAGGMESSLLSSDFFWEQILLGKLEEEDGTNEEELGDGGGDDGGGVEQLAAQLEQRGLYSP